MNNMQIVLKERVETWKRRIDHATILLNASVDALSKNEVFLFKEKIKTLIQWKNEIIEDLETINKHQVTLNFPDLTRANMWWQWYLDENGAQRYAQYLEERNEPRGILKDCDEKTNTIIHE